METKPQVSNGFPQGKVAYFVTTNFHKFQEARSVLSEYHIAVAKLEVDALEIQDDNLENIAKYSAQEAVKHSQLPIFVGDAGLFVEALNGFPGPYSAYVYRTVGPKGILDLMHDKTNRNAYFQTSVVFCSPTQTPVSFNGRVDGTISFEQRGSNGFGYDPIFVPDQGDGRTFAEMTMDEKNLCSHRAVALRKFAQWYSALV
ncbi:MAG: XTP/dITP diphosphatase [Candidatus Bathyarchaeia archaeon]|jgi:XTP/dITP diphosphohydrolase